MSSDGRAGSPPKDATPAAPLQTVLAAFGLDTRSKQLEVIEGGWSHQVWRVDTTTGPVALKQMRPEVGDWWTDQLTAACQFERAAWTEGEIRMPEPLQASEDGGLIVRLGVGESDFVYRCHRWVDSSPSAGERPTPLRSRSIGAITAALHRIDFPTDATTADGLPTNALEAFEATVDEAADRSKPWAAALASLAPLVSELRDDFDRLASLDLPLRFAHRDLDPKNVGTSADGQLVIYDWDYSGPRLAGADVLDVALSFAGGPSDLDAACAVATVEAYREGGLVIDLEGAASIILEEGFRWLMLNAWRSLGHRRITRAQAEFADSLVPGLAASWPAEATAVRALAETLDAR